jgi:transcriptional regulator with XRE-family HTH domain
MPSTGIYLSCIHSKALPKEDRKVPPTLLAAMPKKVVPSSAFGERLLQLRRARGLTQLQLAELIDSSQRAISSYETVLDFPPTHVVIELARALGVSTDELLGLRAPKSRQTLPDDPEARRLWKTFQLVLSLPEKDRRAVIRLVNSLVAHEGARHRRAS